MKRTDTDKISSIKFATKPVLVAEAGNAGTSARALEILRGLARDIPIDDYRVPADLGQRAMIQVKGEIREQHCDCTVEELQDFVWKEELQSELMLAYYFDNKPYIFKLDLAVGRSDKENSWYSAIGCGANLGSYLLSEHTNAGMASGLASIIASCVIETVCKHDAYCSPPAKVGLIINDLLDVAKAGVPLPKAIHPTCRGTGLVLIYSANQIASWSDRIGAIMRSEKLNRNKKIERIMSKEVGKGMKQFESFMASLPNPTAKGVGQVKKLFSGISHFESFKSPERP